MDALIVIFIVCMGLIMLPLALASGLLLLTVIKNMIEDWKR